MLASDIITRARNILQDESPARWLDAELLRWLSDALREVSAAVPESFSVTALHKVLANNLRQNLPSTDNRLFDITRNMGALGATPGATIRLVDRQILDMIDPAWSLATGSEVEHYLYDFKNPGTFMVYPRPTSDIYVEAVYAATPPEVTALNQVISIGNQYQPALIDGTLYRAYSKDAQHGSTAMAAAYKTMFDARLAQMAPTTAQRAPSDQTGSSQA